MEFDFRLQIEQASWALLEPHHRRGALFLVDEAIKLEEVAKAMASDDKAKIEAWLSQSQLVKVSDQQASEWSENSQVFSFTIVQPFVLAQPYHPKVQ